MADEKIRLSQKEVKTLNALKEIGGVHFPVFKDNINFYKLPLSEIEELANKNIIVLPYEAATYIQINEYTQSGKQVIIYYTGVDDDQFWTLSHKTAESSYVFTWLNGNSLVKMTLSSGGLWSKEVINLKTIKDNTYDSVENPTNPDNITEVQELTFLRNQGTGANYPILASEERTYGVLLPAPALQADQGKVPMYKVGDKIGWEYMQTVLTFDTTPTADSTNPVTSGGIKAALDAKQDAFTIVEADASTTGSTVTVSIEQGDLYIVDLSEETSLTEIEIVLTNNAEVAFPLWWFKIESGSAATLSVKIGAVAVGWLGSEITNIALGKTIELSVADGVACGGELV